MNPGHRRIFNRKLILFLLLFIIAASGAYVFWNWWGSRSRAASGADSYLTFVVERGDIADIVAVTGRVTPFDRQQVPAATSGVVSRLLVKEGDVVEKGQLLMELASDDLELAVEQAYINLLLAEEDLYWMLNPEIDEPEELDIETARFKVEEAELALEEKLSLLKKLEITSPLTGQVEFHVNKGDEVIKGDLLATVSTFSELLVEVLVSEFDIPKLHEGQRASVYFLGSGESREGAVHEIPAEGKVRQTSSDGYDTTYFPVLVKLDSNEGILAGMRTSLFIYGERIYIDEYGEVQVEEEGKLFVGRGVVINSEVEEKSIVAEVSGKVTGMTVESGMKVWEGMPLLWLESSELEHQIRQARLTLARAQNELERLLNPEPKDYSAAEIEKQRLRVENARLSLQEKQNKLRELQVTSPISGRIMEVAVEVGDTVSPGSHLFTIADYERMKMVVSVDELEIAKIAEGQEALITVDALPGRQYRGVVISIAEEGSVSGDITTYDVTLEVLEPSDLRDNMMANATIVVEQRRGVLLLPTEAVTFERGSRRGMVEVLVDGKVERRPVQVGLMGTRYIEITGGLDEGDRVVVTGAAPSLQVRVPGGMVPGGTVPPGIAPGGGQDGGMRRFR